MYIAVPASFLQWCFLIFRVNKKEANYGTFQYFNNVLKKCKAIQNKTAWFMFWSILYWGHTLTRRMESFDSKPFQSFRGELLVTVKHSADSLSQSSHLPSLFLSNRSHCHCRVNFFCHSYRFSDYLLKRLMVSCWNVSFQRVACDQACLKLKS